MLPAKKEETMGWFDRVLGLFGVSSGADGRDDNPERKFHSAVHSGNVKTVRTMLAADPQLALSRDEFDFQPIHLMDMYPHEAILKLLLANGADINAVNDEGVTILHLVTDPDAVALLVANGANIEARDTRGWTPLIMQADNQQNGPDVVAALLAHGADPVAEGRGGETALSFARETGDEALIAVLIENGATR